MGAGSSVTGTETCTYILPENFPKQLFVEGAGSAKANGKYLLRKSITSETRKPASVKDANVAAVRAVRRNFWFAKDSASADDGTCWIGFMEARKKNTAKGKSDERKWIIFTDEEILYTAPITETDKEKKSPQQTQAKQLPPPRQGRWDLGGTGATPAPTVNIQLLPSAFRLTGWKGHNFQLNGEYLPLDDGTERLNDRPIFKHMPVVGDSTGIDKFRMYWLDGAWRVGDKDHMQPDQTQCMAFARCDAAHTHPAEIPPDVVWKGAANECDFGRGEDDFELAEDVDVAMTTVSALC